MTTQSGSRGSPSLTLTSQSGSGIGDASSRAVLRSLGAERTTSMNMTSSSGTGALETAGEPAAASAGIAAADEIIFGALGVGSIGEAGRVGD